MTLQVIRACKLAHIVKVVAQREVLLTSESFILHGKVVTCTGHSNFANGLMFDVCWVHITDEDC
jgi:hypothetical protein